MASLQQRATALLAHVGDEGRDDSLVTLRRRVFDEWKRADTTRASAMASADALHAALVVFDRFATDQKLASTQQATSTMWLARALSVGSSLLGLGVCVMAAMRLRRSILALRVKNAALSDLSTNLERKVDERTAALNSRERAMQLVLDSTGEGLVTAELDGTLSPERSRAMTEWFGAPVAGQRLWDLLFPADGNAAAALQVGFEQLGEGFMPFEVAVDQMARRVPFGARTLELDFRQVFEADRLAAVLVIVRDITRRVEAEQAEFASREMQALVGSILRDQVGFTRTVNECEGLIRSLVQCDLVTGRRALHTLKGNSALAGFLSVADAVHALETKLEEEERHVKPEEQAALEAQWKASLGRISEYLSRDAAGRVELDLDELGSFEQKLEGRVEHSVLLEEVRGWRAEPAAVVLQRLAAQARRLAPKLGRQLRVEVKHHQVRLPAERFDSFFAAAVHLVRNAVDHGLEAPQARVDAGKDATGLLTLETRVRGGVLEIVVEDDGHGVDWAAVRAAAQRKGLPSETEAQLIDAMFSDGVSSRTEVSDVSGRGVGLAAVRESVRGEGGKLNVVSRPGKGTRFEFTFPLLTVARAA